MAWSRSTDQIRRWYPEMVRNHHARFTPGVNPRCDYSSAVPVPVPFRSGGTITMRFHPATRDAWVAFTKVMRAWDYAIQTPGSGSLNCRCIGHNPNRPFSLHAYGVAFDVNPWANDGYQTDPSWPYPPGMTNALRRISTNAGDPAFTWLGPTFDAPHWQIAASPDSLQSGIRWSTVKAVMWVRQGDNGWEVERWQWRLAGAVRGRREGPAFTASGLPDMPIGEFGEPMARWVRQVVPSSLGIAIGPGEGHRIEEAWIKTLAPQVVAPGPHSHSVTVNWSGETEETT